MITIFSMPKPFTGKIRTTQRNAIESWTRLQPKCEIILFGDEEGVAETAKEFGAIHIKDVARNEYGTPLLNDVFEKAQKTASNNIVCFINCDIILMNDFMPAVKRVLDRRNKFLMVGRRWNIDINNPIDFSPGWEDLLRAEVHTRGQLHSIYGIDYFVFPRGMITNIPPFAIGRPRYDNWMIFNTRKRHIPIVELSDVVMGVHQNHDYSHLKNRDDEQYRGPESKRNDELLGRIENAYDLYDATWRLGKHGLWPSINPLRRPIGRFKNKVVAYFYIALDVIAKTLFRQQVRISKLLGRYPKS